MNARGIALLEVLMGGLILSIALVGLATLFSEGHMYVHATGSDRIVVGYLQQKLETVRALGFRCIPVADGASSAVNSPEALGAGCLDTAETQRARWYREQPNDGGHVVERVTTVTCVDPNADWQAPLPCPAEPLGKLVRVTVTPRLAKARAIRAETLVARH